MKILNTEKKAIQSLHQPVNHVAGSMRSRKITGYRKRSQIIVQFLNLHVYHSRFRFFIRKRGEATDISDQETGVPGTSRKYLRITENKA